MNLAKDRKALQQYWWLVLAFLTAIALPLSTALQNGQRVEILTIKNGGPSINWLHEGWAKSSKAISHIRRYIRDLNNEDFHETGKEIFDREFGKFTAAVRPKIDDIVGKLSHTNEKDLHIAIGKGDILPSTLKEVIEKLIQAAIPQQKADLTAIELEKRLSERKDKSIKPAKGGSILVEGVSGIVTHFAKCCKAIPGDGIVGFITQGNGVAVHRMGCSDFNRQARLHPQKVVQVDWAENAKSATFSADLEVIANDRHGLLRDLTDLFAIEKLHIVGLRTVCRNNKAIMTFTIQVTGQEFSFTNLIGKIFNVNGVLEVTRK